MRVFPVGLSFSMLLSTQLIMWRSRLFFSGPTAHCHTFGWRDTGPYHRAPSVWGTAHCQAQTCSCSTYWWSSGTVDWCACALWLSKVFINIFALSYSNPYISIYLQVYCWHQCCPSQRGDLLNYGSSSSVFQSFHKSSSWPGLMVCA